MTTDVGVTLPFEGAVRAAHAICVQLGVPELNVPFAWHVAVALPPSTKPALHVYVTLLVYVALAALTVPLFGATAPEHVTGGHVGAAVAHVPVTPHARDAVPVIVYPVLQA